MAETPDAASGSGPPETAAETVPELDRPAGTKVVQEILEQSPLLSPTRLRLKAPAEVTDLYDLRPQRIRETCAHPTCRSLGKMTFALDTGKTTTDIWRYTCTNCGGVTRSYWLSLRPTKTEDKRTPPGGFTRLVLECSILKVGQNPAWQPELPKGVWRPLREGESEDLLARGIACLREGYGIGAAAYFRRVIEDETNAILDQLEAAAAAEDNQPALAQIRKAREQRESKERLKLASQSIPKMLASGGANPVHILYDALSGPLHGDSEEKSLEVARKTLKALTLILGVLRDHLAALKEASKDLAELRDDS